MSDTRTMITTVDQLLEEYPDTCNEARAWFASKQISSLADAWDRCHRGDWMLWLDSKLGLLTDRQRRLIACKCARETPLADGRVTWDLLTDDRSRIALTVAERYASGCAPAEELAAARAAAWDAAAAARAAADAAMDAAWDAADAAWAAAWDSARDAARVAQSDLIREIAGNPFRMEDES